MSDTAQMNMEKLAFFSYLLNAYVQYEKPLCAGNKSNQVFLVKKHTVINQKMVLRCTQKHNISFTKKCIKGKNLIIL